MRIGGWLVAVVLILGVAGIVRLLGGEGDTAAPGASPSAAGTGAELLPIEFGAALAPSGAIADGSETDRFAHGDTFAYAVAGSPAAAAIYVEVRRIDPSPSEQVQAPVEAQTVPDDRTVIGFTVAAAALLDAWGAGTYEMRIHLDPNAAPIAGGTFTLVEPVPSASASP